MIAAHIGNASLDEAAGWTLRQAVAVVRRSDAVIGLINPLAAPAKKTEPVRDPEGVRAVAAMMGLVR